MVKSLPLVRVILRELQRSDLSLLAAYRQIPILTGRVEARRLHARPHPRRVPQDPRRDRRDARRPPTARAPQTTSRASSACPRPKPTSRWSRSATRNVRANVWFHGLDTRSRGRVMVAAELPLLYPLGRSKELPEILYPDAEEGGAAPSPSPHRQARGQAVPRLAPGLPLPPRAWPRRTRAAPRSPLITAIEIRCPTPRIHSST